MTRTIRVSKCRRLKPSEIVREICRKLTEFDARYTFENDPDMDVYND